MAATDIIDIADARAQIRATGNTDDSLIAAYVSACSLTLDELYGPVVARSVVETHDIDRWSDTIFLRTPPVRTITTVVEYTSAGVSTTLTGDTVSSKQTSGFWCRVPSGRLLRRSGGSAACWPAGGSVTVTYSAGRFADTASVDARWKTACRLLFANVFRAEHGSGNVTFGGEGGLPGFLVPNVVSAMLAGEERLPGIA